MHEAQDSATPGFSTGKCPQPLPSFTVHHPTTFRQLVTFFIGFLMKEG
jgi:hypothetical protein